MPECRAEFDPIDVDSFLVHMAGRLRADALALTGYAALHAPMGSGEGDPELEALSDSLRRTAVQISIIVDGLCRTCRMLDVAERLTVETQKHIAGVKESRRRS